MRETVGAETPLEEEEGKAKVLEDHARELWEALDTRQAEASRQKDFRKISLFGDAMRTCMARSPLGGFTFLYNIYVPDRVRLIHLFRLHSGLEQRYAARKSRQPL